MGLKRILITMPDGDMFRQIFVPPVMRELGSFAEVSSNPLGRNYTTEELIQAAEGVDGLLTSWGLCRITTDVIQSAPALKIISHAAGSVKRFIDPAIFDAGVTVTSAAPVMAPSVAEHALALTLALLRNIPQQAEAMREGHLYGSPVFNSNEGLFEQRVGLVGFGNIGKEFARLLKPFRVDLVVYDPYFPQEKAEDYGVTLVGLNELMSTSKVISIHAPITEETRNMVNASNLKLMQDGAVLINTARGWIVDHDDLTAELKTGRIKAALDVTYPEPLPLDHELRTLSNVILTPHIAGPTWDRRWVMAKSAVEDMKLFFQGKMPRNLVTKDMLATMA